MTGIIVSRTNDMSLDLSEVSQAMNLDRSHTIEGIEVLASEVTGIDNQILGEFCPRTGINQILAMSVGIELDLRKHFRHSDQLVKAFTRMEVTSFIHTNILQSLVTHESTLNVLRNSERIRFQPKSLLAFTIGEDLRIKVFGLFRIALGNVTKSQFCTRAILGTAHIENQGIITNFQIADRVFKSSHCVILHSYCSLCYTIEAKVKK